MPAPRPVDHDLRGHGAAAGPAYSRHAMTAFGELLKRWRTDRRLSQEQLAFDASVSTRHLSCLERAKAQPSRDMVLCLARALDLPLRDQNLLLGAAGFAPSFTAAPLDSLALAPVARAVALVLEKAEPYGAVVVDRTWNVLRMNAAAQTLFGHFLLEHDPAVAGNVVKAVLHPKALRPHVVNWHDVATSLWDRLAHELVLHPHDAARRALADEVLRYPGVAALRGTPPSTPTLPTLPVHLRRGDDEVRLFTLLSTVGTPLDVTAQELAIETYFPADDASDEWIRARCR